MRAALKVLRALCPQCRKCVLLGTTAGESVGLPMPGHQPRNGARPGSSYCMGSGRPVEFKQLRGRFLDGKVAR